MPETKNIQQEHRFFLNMGPQHPSTHGVLRVILEMDGEYIVEPEPVLGYGHRMQEKMAEGRSWPGFLPNTGRMDYAGALPYNHGYVALIERLAGVEVPLRAEYIRVITSELSRIASHLIWFGALLLDLGAFTPILYTFDDREQILDALEDITGSRLTYCYFRVGGVCKDIDDTFISRVRAFIKRLRSRFSMYEKLVNGNIIFLKRMEGIGIIDADMCRRYGATGPVARGSGIPYDIRKCEPYSVYPEFDFEIPLGDHGDALDRFLVRFRELEQSLRIIEQALDKLPDGPYLGKVPKKLKLPTGDCNFSVETARGALAYYLVSDGSEVPYRLKIRVPSYSNLSVLPELCRGMLLSDLVTAMGSLDLVIPEIDR
ncbi:MAG: NADH-quinone oxidoreductase subunit D [Deltaproteobacteria bacterium]|nr:NADH-quinone oxidoreductase subunit D [Candidatus Anaeroferrophillus wilburensis]MBN2889980.1 NADH-quinone oxidoreductase subunit D [Deltaproteobacteria bacterium]